MDPLPLLNLFTKRASQQAKLGGNVWPLNAPTHSPHTLDVTDHFAAAFDTLAAVCETSHRIAMTVTLPPDERMIIALAENRCEVENTVEFLQSLWSALKCLRGNSGSVEKRNDIFVIAYRHGFHRLKQHVSSMWMDAMHFYGFWETSTTKSGDESIHGELRAAFRILSRVFDSLTRTDTSNPVQMVDLVTQIHSLYAHCEVLSNARAILRQWCNDYEQAFNGTARFPLRRYFTGCLALYINIVSLIDVMDKTEFDDMFCRTLRIKAIQPVIVTLDYPLDKSFYESYLDDILDRCEILAAKNSKLWQALEGEITHAIATANEMKSATIHCELRLLSFHQNQRLVSTPEEEVGTETATPPQNYIATSQPPCYACAVFMDAYRSELADVFDRMCTQAQSANPRLQVPWAMPKLGNAEVDRSVQRTVFMMICLDYAKFIGQQFGYRLPRSTQITFKRNWQYNR
ncbi:hypothetical protein BD410DRAFT_840029 [Rickenella mellea]|uniref:Uncharacterized protein n=1 Tax=Rickenella mellea TaxID=50990 RepID=A0A4Y7Q3J7_9AGAM|nr:hypothetical protein BD410DRAFT_840029 [Rickenella mellea]